MKWLPSSADIPEDLIRAARDGEVVFLCGAGVSLAAGLPLFKDLTDKVYETIGVSISDEAAEETAYQTGEFDRVLRSLEKRTRPPGAESAVRKAVIDALQPPPDASDPDSLFPARTILPSQVDACAALLVGWNALLQKWRALYALRLTNWTRGNRLIE
jgi:hypothetical protein